MKNIKELFDLKINYTEINYTKICYLVIISYWLFQFYIKNNMYPIIFKKKSLVHKNIINLINVKRI